MEISLISGRLAWHYLQGDNTVKYIDSWNNLHNQDAEQIHCHVAPIELLLKLQLLPLLNSPSNTLFSISVIFLFLEDSINGVTQYLNFYVLTQQNSLVVHPG